MKGFLPFFCCSLSYIICFLMMLVRVALSGCFLLLQRVDQPIIVAAMQSNNVSDIGDVPFDAMPFQSRSTWRHAKAWLKRCFANNVDCGRQVQLVVDVKNIFPPSVLRPGPGVPVGRGRDAAPSVLRPGPGIPVGQGRDLPRRISHGCGTADVHVGRSTITEGTDHFAAGGSSSRLQIFIKTLSGATVTLE